MSALPAQMPAPPSLDPLRDTSAVLGLALQGLAEGERLPGPLAPLTSFIAMAYRKALPTFSERWVSRWTEENGEPVRSGKSPFDPNSRVYGLATDVLVLLEMGKTDEAALKVVRLTALRDGLAPVVAAAKQYLAAHDAYQQALPVEIRD